MVPTISNTAKLNVQIALSMLTIVLCYLYDGTAEVDLLGRRRHLQLVGSSDSSESAADSGTYAVVAGMRFGHKDLFPLDSSDYWGTFLVALGSMIAASGGIGGGGMLVPLLILVFDFEPKHAIPLSNFTIVGSSITNMYMNLSKRHPDADRPCVDWDLILVMEPLTMVGAVVGAFMSKVLSETVLSLSLVILLAVTTKTTMEKGISQWNKETAAFELEKKGAVQQALDAEIELTESNLLLDDDADDADDGNESHRSSIGISVDIVTGADSKATSESPLSSESPASPGALQAEDDLLSSIGTQFQEDEASASSRKLSSAANKAELGALLEEEKEASPEKMKVITFMVLGVILLNLLKGGKADVFPSPLGIKCGGSGYWLVQVLVLVLVLCVSYWGREKVMEKWRTKARLGFKYIPGDVEWNESNTIKYPGFCFFAGFFAGMFGVGGGIVKGPLMLHMGVNPIVASATVAVMIMFTSISATAMFVAFGTLKWDYAWFLFFVGLTTTMVGQFGVSYLIQKYRRVSLVSLSIGAVVAISTLLMALESILALTGLEKSESDNSVCG